MEGTKYPIILDLSSSTMAILISQKKSVLAAITLCFIIITLGVFFTGCIKTKAIVRYHELLDLIYQNSLDRNALDSAITAKDYAKAENIRIVWEDHLGEAIEKIKKEKCPKEVYDLNRTLEEGLQCYKIKISTDYKKLISLYVNQKNGHPSAQAEATALSTKMHNDIELVRKKVNNAKKEFTGKYRLYDVNAPEF